MPALRREASMHDADQTLIGRRCLEGGGSFGGGSYTELTFENRIGRFWQRIAQPRRSMTRSME
jgi:hypothetical protein